ncbi:Rz1-like lysis system protein LysC [Rhodanobacter hydrolyticus]
MMRAALLCLVLAGCTAPPPITAPRSAAVVVQDHPLPDYLTEHCAVALPVNQSVAEVVRVANERKQALIACNAKLDTIRSIQGKKP